MAAIEMILQRMMWASCFCLALTLYSNSSGASRTLPQELGETPQFNHDIQGVDLAQRLGQEIGSRVESQSIYTYLLSRTLSVECSEKSCPQYPLE